MPIFKITSDSIDPVARATFAELKLTERGDLQRLLRDQIEIISKDTLVIAEEFCDWDDSRRRIDLLAIDKEARIVVIELKRTEDGGHMDLQAIRYAAMVSTLTLEQAILAFDSYLKSRNDPRNALTTIKQFLEWDDEIPEDGFGQEVRIVLASAEFSKELTTTVLWLREQKIDIRCVRIQPYGNTEDTLLDVQQVVPLPEAEDYQIRIQRKTSERRAARESSRDYTRFNVSIGSETIENLPKRRAALRVVKGLIDHGVEPDALASIVTWRYLFFKVQGQRTGAEMIEHITNKNGESNVSRWFVRDEELIHRDGHTYATCNQWGPRTEDTIGEFLALSDQHNISVEARH